MKHLSAIQYQEVIDEVCMAMDNAGVNTEQKAKVIGYLQHRRDVAELGSLTVELIKSFIKK